MDALLITVRFTAGVYRGSDLARPEPLPVNGHQVLPNHGHRFSPLVATESPRWWPSFLPTVGVLGGQCRGVTPLPAVACASR